MIRRYFQQERPSTSPAVLVRMSSSRSTNQYVQGPRRADVEPITLREGAFQEDTNFQRIMFVRRDAQRWPVRHFRETTAVDVHVLEGQAVRCGELNHGATLPPSPWLSYDS